jgi:hypothetical protein
MTPNVSWIHRVADVVDMASGCAVATDIVHSSGLMTLIDAAKQNADQPRRRYIALKSRG